jgi:gamma-glutamyltranspeptidase/glutathione hydrolase
LLPGKKPFHTLNPALAVLKDGRTMVYGSMGGDGQPQYMVQLIDGLVRDGLDPQQAVDRPRFVAETEGFGLPLRTVAIEEDGTDAALLEGLRRRGHEVRTIEPRTPAVGWAQAIRREPDGSYVGGADPRADSLGAGT